MAKRISRDTLTLVTVIGGVGLFAVALGGVLYWASTNPCQRLRPHQVLGGHIWTEGGFLSGSVTNYKVAYKGRHARTGKDCKAYIRVTEAEYERRMYGR